MEIVLLVLVVNRVRVLGVLGKEEWYRRFGLGFRGLLLWADGRDVDGGYLGISDKGIGF